MAGPSTFMQGKLINGVFGAVAYSWPATVYIGVSTVANSTANVDATVAAGEPTIGTGSYARIVVTNNTTNFPTATGTNPTLSKLHVSFSFAASSAAWTSGASALESWMAFDAATAGNMLWNGPLVPATDVVNGAGVTLSFAIDALTASLNQS